MPNAHLCAKVADVEHALEVDAIFHEGNNSEHFATQIEAFEDEAYERERREGEARLAYDKAERAVANEVRAVKMGKATPRLTDHAKPPGETWEWEWRTFGYGIMGEEELCGWIPSDVLERWDRDCIPDLWPWLDPSSAAMFVSLAALHDECLSYHPKILGSRGAKHISEVKDMGEAMLEEHFGLVRTWCHEAMGNAPDRLDALQTYLTCVKRALRNPPPGTEHTRGQEPGEGRHGLSDEERQRAMCEGGLATAIGIVFLLHDLRRMQHFYPENVDPQEAAALEKELTDRLGPILATKGFEGLNEMFVASACDDTSPESRYAAIAGEFLSWHPDSPKEHISMELLDERILALVTNCLEQAGQSVRKVFNRIQEIQITDCRIPHPANDATFQEPRRFVQLLREYWGLGRRVVLHHMDAPTGPRPHPLLLLLMNLRLRISECFGKLDSLTETVEWDQERETYFATGSWLPGASEAQSTMSSLLEMAVGGEPDALSAAPEWTSGEMAKVETFLEQSRLLLGSKTYPLTREEQLFLQVTSRAITEYEERVKSTWGVVKNHKRKAEQGRAQPLCGPQTTSDIATNTGDVGEAASGEGGIDEAFLKSVVDEVHSVLFDPAHPERLRRAEEQLNAAVEMEDRREQARRQWKQQLAEHVKEASSKPRWRNKEAGPPEPGWEWADLLDLMIESGEVLKALDGQENGAWLPPVLRGRPQLPPSPMRSVASAEDAAEIVLMRQYLVLAVVHDNEDRAGRRHRRQLLEDIPLRRPWVPATDLGRKSMLAGSLSGFDRGSIERALKDVKADLAEAESVEPLPAQDGKAPAGKRHRKEPPDIAIAAYRMHFVTGVKQTEIAARLRAEFKRPVSQGQVSRWIRAVKKFVKAGNVLPSIEPMTHKPRSVDPSILDMGRRQDGLVKRQRRRRDPDSTEDRD